MTTAPNQFPSTPLLNGAFQLPADGMFQFTPLGEFPLLDSRLGRIVQVVDAEAVSAMAADIAARKAEPGWPGLLVDRDHFSFDTEKESRAAGWANDAQARADGLYGPIRFSASGKSDVEGGDFRFLSPVFDDKSAVPLGGNRYRVVRLLGLALTNKPNIRTIRALTNRSPGGDPANSNPTEKNMNPDLLKELGLPPTATAEEALVALRALKAKASSADASASEVSALKNRYNGLLTAAVDRTLADHAGVITDREVWKNRLMENFDGTTALLKGLKTPAPAAPDAKKIDDTLAAHAGVITAESRDAWKNRLTADFDGTLALLKGIKQAPSKTPMHKQAPAAAVSADGAQDEAAHPFLNRVNELRKADPKLGEADAMVQAASDDPALYESYRRDLTPDE